MSASPESVSRVPKAVKIGPITYGVVIDRDGMYEDDLMGHTSKRGRLVRLTDMQADTELPATFLHEVLHAVGQVYRIPEVESHSYNKAGDATDKIDELSLALLQFLRDNPEVVAWLTQSQ